MHRVHLHLELPCFTRLDLPNLIPIVINHNLFLSVINPVQVCILPAAPCQEGVSQVVINHFSEGTTKFLLNHPVVFKPECS